MFSKLNRTTYSAASHGVFISVLFLPLDLLVLADGFQFFAHYAGAHGNVLSGFTSFLCAAISLGRAAISALTAACSAEAALTAADLILKEPLNK